MEDNGLIIGGDNKAGQAAGDKIAGLKAGGYPGLYRFEPPPRYSQKLRSSKMIFFRKSAPASVIDMNMAIQKLRANAIYRGAKSVLIVIDDDNTRQLDTVISDDGKTGFRILKRHLHLLYPGKQGAEAAIKPVSVDMAVSGCQKWTPGGSIYDGHHWKHGLFRKLAARGFIRAGTLLVALGAENQRTPYASGIPIFNADLILNDRGLDVVFDERTRLPRYAVRLIESYGGTIDMHTPNSTPTEVKDVNE